jgi:hypothetical protein
MELTEAQQTISSLRSKNKDLRRKLKELRSQAKR